MTDETTPTRKTVRTSKVQPEVEKPTPLYVVGIGSSAGGLEALEGFFRNLPSDTGLVFVLVPHLAPDHKGMLSEILQRFTQMKITQAKDGMTLQPNCVYVIPPNKNMSIVHSKLQLLDLVPSNGVRLPDRKSVV